MLTWLTRVFTSRCLYFHFLQYMTLHGLCKSSRLSATVFRWSTIEWEPLRRCISDRWRSVSCTRLDSKDRRSSGFCLAEKQWRTRTRWLLDSLVYLPRTLISNITSWSLKYSHHEFSATPSTNSSSVWKSL